MCYIMSTIEVCKLNGVAKTLERTKRREINTQSNYLKIPKASITKNQTAKAKNVEVFMLVELVNEKEIILLSRH